MELRGTSRIKMLSGKSRVVITGISLRWLNTTRDLFVFRSSSPRLLWISNEKSGLLN